jgi:hypothetical protein
MLWLQSARSVLLALRIIAFEKTDETSLGIWTAVTLPVTVVLFATSVPSAAFIFLGVMTAFFFVFRRGMRRSRFRLVRIADRVEYADVSTTEDDYRQRFTTGVVLQRMGPEDVKRSGKFDPDTMGEAKHFYLVRSRSGTRIIPFEMIVGIELDGLED